MISGTPGTTAVTSTVTIAAANAVGVSGTASLTITVSPVVNERRDCAGTVGVIATQYTIPRPTRRQGTA